MQAHLHLRYCSFVDHSGYGLAAIAYVRALLLQGCSVEWVALELINGTVVAKTSIPDIINNCQDDKTLSDLPVLWAKTRARQTPQAVIWHCVPEGMLAQKLAGVPFIAYIAWETTRPPAHWDQLLRQLDALWVPSTHNRDAFRTTLPAHIPIHVVPHIKRHRDTDVSTQARTQLMTSLKLERCRCVFYTVNTWTPRKNIDLLVEQFALAFREQHHLPDAPVLLIKTSETGSGKAPYYSDTYTRDLLNQAITAAAKKFSLTHAPQIRLLADNKLSGNALDILRSLAHIYVSLSSGEGFGMEAAEAAGRGVPVLMCAWSGPVDFMGQAWAQALGQPDSQGDWQLPPNWSGALAYRLVPCGVWPPMSPSYWPSQKMAEPEQAAVQAGLRYAAEHLNTLRARATLIAETYANTHCSARIAQQMLSLLAPHLTVATHG